MAPADDRTTPAGGYDPQVRENKENYESLVALAAESKLTTSEFPDFKGQVESGAGQQVLVLILLRTVQVVFLRSFSEYQRSWLLDKCMCVLYTPEGEHFGIVPVEGTC